MGIDWPVPRFTDNSDGTVTDNLTGLIWLKQANCFGARPWTQALSDVNGLENGMCGLADNSIAGDWRLPNIRELESLTHYGFYNPPLSNTEGTGQWEEGDPFTNVWSDYYWSATTLAYSPSFAWSVSFYGGYVDVLNKDLSYYVRAVRGGQ